MSITFDRHNAIAQLAERWPQCFAVHVTHRRPLKVGIHNDIIAQLDTALPGVMMYELRRALRHYVCSRVYRSKLLVGAERVDLDGAAAGVVTESQIEHDRKKMEEWRKRSACPPKKAKQQPVPQRDGLAQLRAAAQRRKAASVANEMKTEVEYQR